MLNILDITGTTSSQILKNLAEEQLKKLLSNSEKIQSYQSDLDSIIKRYKINQSFFTKVAVWDGELAWWAKLGIGIAVIGGSILIGIFLNMVVLAVIIVCVYLATAFLLYNHYSNMLAQEEILADDIELMEEEISLATESIRSLEKKLNEVLVALCEKNIQLAEEITILGENIKKLDEEIVNFESKINFLEKIKCELLNSKEQFTTSFKMISSNLDHAEKAFEDKSNQLSFVTSKLEQAEAKLSEGQLSLAQIKEQYSQHVAALETERKELSEQLAVFKVKLLERIKAEEELCIKLRHMAKSVTETPLISEEIQATLARARQIGIEADTYFTDSEKEINLKFSQKASSVTETLTQSEEVQAILAKARQIGREVDDYFATSETDEVFSDVEIENLLTEEFSRLKKPSFMAAFK